MRIRKEKWTHPSFPLPILLFECVSGLGTCPRTPVILYSNVPRPRERLSSNPNVHNLLKYVQADRAGLKSSLSAASLGDPCVTRFLATIVFSSTAVELVLNRDQRTRRHRQLRRIGGWAALNNPNLAIAARERSPVHLLLSESESLSDPRPVRFVERRHKVAHGEICDMIKDLTDYDPKAEEEAFDQLDKGHRFIVEWFNTAPDVQESHIKNYRWPE